MNVLITAGPTREKLDPVRFLSNCSSGRLGIACAEAARRAGHNVVLVLGPTALEPPAGVETIRVQSADEMAGVVAERRHEMQWFVFTAAVADWTPINPEAHKIRKSDVGETFNIECVRTRDIFAETTTARLSGQVIVGFCLETRDHVDRAKDKLDRKDGDVIIANDVATLSSDRITAWWVDRKGHVESLPEMAKDEFANELLKRLARHQKEISGAAS